MLSKFFPYDVQVTVYNPDLFLKLSVSTRLIRIIFFKCSRNSDSPNSGRIFLFYASFLNENVLIGQITNIDRRYAPNIRVRKFISMLVPNKIIMLIHELYQM